MPTMGKGWPRRGFSSVTMAPAGAVPERPWRKAPARGRGRLPDGPSWDAARRWAGFLCAEVAFFMRSSREPVKWLPAKKNIRHARSKGNGENVESWGPAGGRRNIEHRTSNIECRTWRGNGEP